MKRRGSFTNADIGLGQSSGQFRISRVYVTTRVPRREMAAREPRGFRRESPASKSIPRGAQASLAVTTTRHALRHKVLRPSSSSLDRARNGEVSFPEWATRNMRRVLLVSWLTFRHLEGKTFSAMLRDAFASRHVSSSPAVRRASRLCEDCRLLTALRADRLPRISPFVLTLVRRLR